MSRTKLRITPLFGLLLCLSWFGGSPLRAQLNDAPQIQERRAAALVKSAIGQIDRTHIDRDSMDSELDFDSPRVEVNRASIHLTSGPDRSPGSRSATFDLARHRLLAVHEQGRVLYSWPGPESVAHRGNVLGAPENTLAAIEEAIQQGASRAEIDVRTTQDGELVLLHDTTVDRTTDGTGAVREMSSSQLFELDAGSWFDSKFADQRIPTLRQTLERMKGRIAPDLDLKDADSTTIVSLLRELDLIEQATVFTRDWNDAKHLLELEPALRLRPSLPSGPDGLERLVEALDPPIVNIDWQNFTEEVILEIHRQGRLAFVNTLGEGDGRERLLLALSSGADFVQSDQTALMTELTSAWRTTPHAGRTLLDAHNAYPHGDRFLDRIDRALATGLPLAIEQDLCFVGEGPSARSIVSHGEPFTGNEPDLEESFFSRVTPLLERELETGDPRQWPVLVLNLDFKHDPPEHHAWIERLLTRHERFLTVAERTASIETVAPLRIGPLLVLTGSQDAQQLSFHDQKEIGATLRLFGAVRTDDEGLPEPVDNYRRWWNNPWRVIEGEAQPLAAEWLPEEEERLETLVRVAHRRGVWLRFYTLNGHPRDQAAEHGWTPSYNFGSQEGARTRWRAATELGVDFIASDQYEALALTLEK